ncbi:zinc finger protein 135-like isoform X2 [Puntigrus tetrazona]|nr:zinc finger protein 135-like isoform X2 [Puntigrus tetrazona]
MEALVQTAVLEIGKLVEVECEVLLSEVSRSRGEISSLRRTLRLMEVQPRENTGQTPTESLTCVKSERGQEETHGHLNKCRGPREDHQDQDSPQRRFEASTVKQEQQEVDVWIGRDDSEAGSQCGEAVSLIRDALKTASPSTSPGRGSRENAAARFPSTAEAPDVNRGTSPNGEPDAPRSLSASDLARTNSGSAFSADKRFVCSYCSKRFRCFSQLTIHQRSHTGEKPYRCTLCGKRYIQKGHLYTHQRTHTGEKPYQCSLCGKGFIQKCTLDMHLRSHTGEKPYTCTKCGKGFTTKFNLNKHLSCQSCNGIS